MSTQKCFGKVFMVVMAIFLISSITSSYAKAEVIEWRMQSIYPDSDTTKPCNADPIVNTLNKRLEGKLHITYYSAGQIVPEETMFSALGKGVFEMALTAPTWSLGVVFDGIVAAGLPMAWRGDDEALDFFYKYGFIDHARKLFAKHNIYYAAPIPAGPISFMGNFAFKKPEDIKGKKLWSIGPHAALVKTMGGIPVTFPVAEIYTSIKLGTIDGCVLGYGELEGMGIKEVVKYYNAPAYLDPFMCCLMINSKAWNDLPKDIQKTIDETLIELQQTDMRACYKDFIGNSLKKAKEAGVEEIRWDSETEDFVLNASKKVWNEIEKKCKDPETVKILKAFAAAREN